MSEVMFRPRLHPRPCELVPAAPTRPRLVSLTSVGCTGEHEIRFGAWSHVHNKSRLELVALGSKDVLL